MEFIRSNINGYPGNHVKLEVDDPKLAFTTAKDIAKQKAKELCYDPMLLSWFNGETGDRIRMPTAVPATNPPG